ncbi:MAG: PTS sugar transporter subunit IIB [Aerococcaceae bacterium]|nr:PTS sugar transporter subunit IIB [Aerococcaceae bacterium]
MVNIVLVCSAGMSTSMLVKKMEAAAQEESFECTIKAIASTEAIEYAKEGNTDVILLGPQVKFMESKFKSELSEYQIPIEMIKIQDYGTMNGKNVLEQAKKILGVG